MWVLALGQEHTLRISDNRAMRKLFDPKRETGEK